MEEHQYQYRTVTVGHRRHTEIRGFQPVDAIELNELLCTMQQKHGWSPGLQVFVGPREEGVGAENSAGLSAYQAYVSEVRVGPHRNDVVVTPWTRDKLL